MVIYTQRKGSLVVKTITFPVLSGEGLWYAYQKEAEEIVAPGGVLIADPRERNRAINAAYARLWLHDNRFQWAGLAAFASKQVGCGLLHAAASIEKIQVEHEARQRMIQGAEFEWGTPGVFAVSKADPQQYRDYEQARSDNPVTGIDFRGGGEQASYMEKQFQHVYDMLAMGNTTLFLDVFPLHAFYAKRGFKEFEKRLHLRKSIYERERAPVLWPIGQDKLKFGIDHQEVLQAFAAIEEGHVDLSVRLLAEHEQMNILQPAMYSNSKLVDLLRRNQLAYGTYIFRHISQPVELTLASQCHAVDDSRTIGFSRKAFADLSDLDQRMPFVLKAAKRFDELLRSDKRDFIERAIRDIALSKGGR
ncbi:DUF2515 family protein [Pseudomonas maioricensis]